MFYSHSFDFGFLMRKSFECYFCIGFDSFICNYIRLIWVIWLQRNYLEPNPIGTFSGSNMVTKLQKPKEQKTERTEN